MYRGYATCLDDRVPTSMKQSSSVVVFDVAMALFGMVWLLRVRSEMRRCSKCKRDEMLTQQHSQHGHQQQHHQHNRPTSSLLQTPEDGLTMSSANTLFTLDTPGATGPAGSYCEVHGYVAPKEGIVSS